MTALLDRLVSDGASETGARLENQDGWGRWCRRGIGAIFAVADGLGGHADGRMAAGIALAAATETFRDPAGSAQKAAMAAVEAAAVAVREARAEAGSNMGTTLVVLVLIGDRAGWAWCGDSRLYRQRGDMIERLSEDHSAAMARLDPDERAHTDVRGDPARNRLISVIGEEDPLIGQGGDAWYENDRFVLCSDGFWEGTSRAEIAAALEAGLSAQAMLDMVLAKDIAGQDNLTLLIAGAELEFLS